MGRSAGAMGAPLKPRKLKGAPGIFTQAGFVVSSRGAPNKETRMPAAQFTPPRHWEDWCSWGLGIWLCISPWVLRFDLQPIALQAAVVTGFLLILVEAVTLSVFRAWEEWINVVLAAWLIAAPWLLGVADLAATVNFVVVGALVLALAVYEIQQSSGADES